jgi:Gpi18-like mannosyltransferase
MLSNTLNKTMFVVFCISTFLVIAVCVFLLLPQIQTSIIEYFISKGVIEGTRVMDYYYDKLTKDVFIGFGCYLFVLFLILLENITIKNELSSKSKNIMFILLITVFSIAIRVAGFNHQSGDYFIQSRWVAHLRENGHFWGFKTFPGNYNAIYMYFLALLSYIPFKYELYCMKLISCIFDFVLAVYSMRLLNYMSHDKKTGLIMYLIVLFSPTVFINSGVWAQCDSMYAAFTVMALYYLVNSKYGLSMFLFGISFSFKLQAIFTIILFILYFIGKKQSLKNFVFIPAGLIVVSIPAWFLGWPLVECIANYLSGVNLSGLLTKNAPTIFAWGNIPGLMPVIFITAIIFSISFHFISKKIIISNNTVLLLFLFSNFVVPFFLPNMHERYFYVGEVAVLMYSVLNAKRFPISLFVILPALATYCGYLFGTNPFTLQQLSVVMLFGCIVIVKWLIEEITKDQLPVET